MQTALAGDVHWIGAIDWTVRDFHGYTTDRGSTYNAYLVQAGKTAVIDTVKAPFAAEMLRRLTALVDPAKVDYLVCNHAEPDHAGSLPALLQACPNATLVCDEKCRTALGLHYDTTGWPFQVVASGDTLSLEGLTLSFLETPMVHWPESMATYLVERRILFSMDAFGQHYASAHRFDDEGPLDLIMREAKTYYANIVMLYSRPIAKVLEQAADMAIDMIAPSHGVVWRTHIPKILGAYRDWVAHRVKPKVLVMYDTMWKSTELMAHAIVEGAAETGAEVVLHHVRASNITVLATETLDAAAIAVGTPTLNKTLMPEMAAVLTYLKGLSPVGKAGFVFGSYGWAKGGAQDAEAYLKAMKFDILRDPLQVQFVPDAAALEACREAGRQLGLRAVSAGA